MNLPIKVRVLNVFRRVWMIPVLESFLARKTRGLPPGHFVCKWVPNPYQYKTETFRLIKRDGITMKVDISDYIGHYLYFGFQDSGMQRLFSLCAEGATVVDVGANIGWTALRMAHLAVRGRVYAFEPDPYNAEQCLENIRRNDLTNIELFSIGLGNTDTTAAMEVRTPSNRGGNRIAPQGVNANRLVRIIRMDDFSTLRNLNKIDLIKIDVEGYELQVLKGAREILLKYKPVLFFELDDNNLHDQADSSADLIRFLAEVGYTSLVNAETGSSLNQGTDFANCHMDVIARP